MVRGVREQPFVPLVLRLPRPGEQGDEPPEVRAGAEGGAGARQHGNPHLCIVAHLPPSLVKADGQLGIDGVAHLWTIEGNEGDMPPPFIVEHCHEPPPQCFGERAFWQNALSLQGERPAGGVLVETVKRQWRLGD